MPDLSAAAAGLVGTYRLVSTTAKDLETGAEESYGNESGTITYGADGRMIVLLVRGARPRPASLDAMTDAERADLFRTMTAYSGTWSFDGTTVSHHVDVAWNEMWKGTTQQRMVTRDGNRVLLTTHPSPRSRDGRIGTRTMVFEKV